METPAATTSKLPPPPGPPGHQAGHAQANSPLFGAAAAEVFDSCGGGQGGPMLCPEVSRALSGVLLIAEQKKRMEESTKVQQLRAVHN